MYTIKHLSSRVHYGRHIARGCGEVRLFACRYGGRRDVLNILVFPQSMVPLISFRWAIIIRWRLRRIRFSLGASKKVTLVHLLTSFSVIYDQRSPCPFPCNPWGILDWTSGWPRGFDLTGVDGHPLSPLVSSSSCSMVFLPIFLASSCWYLSLFHPTHA